MLKTEFQLFRFSLPLILIGIATIFDCGQLAAESNWNRFRGENGSGILPECIVPLPWEESDIAWKVQLPGKGNGSPIIQGDHVYVLSGHAESAERYVLAFDLVTGKELWRKSFPSEVHSLHVKSSYGSCTPCSDENAVYVAWGTPAGLIVKAFSHDGVELWSQDFGRHISRHGFGGSPMRVGNLLILLDSQDARELPAGVAPGESKLVAMEASTGKKVWQIPRVTTNACYGVPAIAKGGDGKDMLLLGETAEGFFAVDPQSGKQLWKNGVFSKRVVSSPLVVGNLVFNTEGSGGGGNILFAIDMNKNNELAFKITSAAPYVPTPVALGNLLFLWADNGIVSCLELPSGEVVWQKRVGGNVSSSPVIAGNKLIGTAEDGKVTILAASRDYKVLGEESLGENSKSTPALNTDCILFRTNSQLIRIGLPKSSQQP